MPFITENYRTYNGYDICKNYGGCVIVDGYDYNIYKSFESAKNAIRKRRDGSHKRDPVIIGKMTDEQFVNALKI